MDAFLGIKKILSYLIEQHVESHPSDINPHLYVSLSKGRYQLSTAHAIYSFEDLYDNFAKTFACLEWSTFKPERILILGGGLLSVPQLIDQHNLINCIYDVVEIDDHVIYLADKYIRDKIKHPIHWHHDAAESFMQQIVSQGIYDLIIVDVFEDDTIPAVIQSAFFLQSCQRALSREGLLLYNCLSRIHKDRSATKAFMQSTFSQVFTDGGFLDVQGNYILYSCPDFWLKDSRLQPFSP